MPLAPCFRRQKSISVSCFMQVHLIPKYFSIVQNVPPFYALFKQGNAEIIHRSSSSCNFLLYNTLYMMDLQNENSFSGISNTHNLHEGHFCLILWKPSRYSKHLRM